MSKLRRMLWTTLLLSSWPGVALADDAAAQDPLLRALTDELARAAGLSVPGAPAPYYVALRALDSQQVAVEASFGALVLSESYPDRRLFADVRVGSYEHDNGNFEPDRAWSDLADQSRRWLPFENDLHALRRDAWLAIDAGYKGALRAFGQKSAAQTHEQTTLDRVADFSREPAVLGIDSTAVEPLDPKRLEDLVKALSNVGRSIPSISNAAASVSGATERRLFVSSEGSRVIEPRAHLELSVVFHARTDDGMPVAHFLELGACQADRLPSNEILQAEARRVAQELEQIRGAPLVDDYTGPVLFEGIAAPQLVSQVLGDELSGTPPAQSNEMNSLPDSLLAAQVGQRILPPGYTLLDDPSLDHLDQTPLAGCYRYDDEGVAAQKITLIEDGIFKAFVMSRTPRKGFDHSNGHGRESYLGTRGRIANLVLTSKTGVSKKQLRQQLLGLARAANKPYALIVQVLDVPALTQQKSNPMLTGASNDEHRVLVLSKLTLDGKEQLLRGAALQTIELRSLKGIRAAGKTFSVFSSYSDSVASPALLFEDVTVTRAAAPRQKPPLMLRPDLGN
jgi:hypothetical protein